MSRHGAINIGLKHILQRITDKETNPSEYSLPPDNEIPVGETPVKYQTTNEAPSSFPCEREGCPFTSGTLNSGNKLRFSQILKDLKLKRNNKDEFTERYIAPPPITFDKRPVINDYLRKKLILWDPEWQYKVKLQDCWDCSEKKCVVFKEYSSPRHVHDLASDCYYSVAVHRCRKCKKTVRADAEILVEKGIVPVEIALQCPVHTWTKTAWTSELVEILVDMVSSRAQIGDFISVVRKARTSTYLKLACRYYGHVRWFTRDISISTQYFIRTSDNFPDFPRYFSHCGSNGTLGPSRQMAEDIQLVARASGNNA